jgi:hypothetical protein
MISEHIIALSPGQKCCHLNVGVPVVHLGEDDVLHGVLADAGTLQGTLQALDVLDPELDRLVRLPEIR